MEWPATVERLVDAGDGRVVPGHGDVGDRVRGPPMDGVPDDRRAGSARPRRDDRIDAAVLRTPYPADTAREPLERALAQLRGELD
jgi:hypothetical protein